MTARLPACPSWCDLAPGHRRARVDGHLVREHLHYAPIAAHQQWSRDQAVIVATERDEITDSPTLWFRCTHTRPDDWDGPATWQRNRETWAGGTEVDLCTRCRLEMHPATIMGAVRRLAELRHSPGPAGRLEPS